MFKKCVFGIVLIFTLIFISSCTGSDFKKSDFFAMNTVITLNVDSNGKDTDYNELFENAKKFVLQCEANLSRTIVNSDGYHVNSDAMIILDVNDAYIEVLKKALEVAQNSDGAYDPTVGSLADLWNITGENPTVPKDEEIKKALESVNYKSVTVDKNKITKDTKDTKIDLGGIAKGYSCSLLIDYLKDCGLSYGIVSFGGNIGTFGTKPDLEEWKIGIKNPKDTGDVIGYVNIDSGYISVSGDYERYFEYDGKMYHHIFDPSTGYPANSGLSSVAVISNNAIEADALSTALFVMGYEKSIEFYNKNIYKFEAVFTTSNGEVLLTDGIKDSFEFKE